MTKNHTVKAGGLAKLTVIDLVANRQLFRAKGEKIQWTFLHDKCEIKETKSTKSILRFSRLQIEKKANIIAI